jgi:hypothetical protein
MTKDQWLDRQVRSARSLGKWVFAPFLLLYLGLSVTLIVHGIRS